MVCSCANICNFYQTSASYWPWIRYLLLCKTSPVEIVTTLYILYQSHVIITYMPAGINKSIQRNFRNLLLLNYFDPSFTSWCYRTKVITLYINICKIMFFSSTQFAYIYVHSYFMLVTQQTYLYASIQFSVSVL